MSFALRAGVGRVELAPSPGLPMMGYGAREGVAQPGGEPLSARALYLEAGDREGVLLVFFDLCLLAPVQCDRVRAALAQAVGVHPARILVACIHTHSGPETGFGALLVGRPEPDFVAPLLDAGVRAGRQAFASRAPARLGFGLAKARVGRNRRRADGPLDEQVRILRVDAPDGAPRAVLFVHGCHPTALGHDNLRYSPDWPGAARRRIEAALPGATALFALGAHADVDPRTRGLLDLAISGQSRGVGFEAMEALGRQVGQAAAQAALGIRSAPVQEPALVEADSVGVPLAAHRPDEAARQAAFQALGLPPDAEVGTADLFRLEQARTEALPHDARRQARARVRRYLRDRTAHRFAFGERAWVEAQVLRVGPLRLLALPLEPTVAVGRDWAERAGGPHAAVLGLANGWMRYLPHVHEFEAPDAACAYEVLQSTFQPDAAVRLLEAGELLLKRLEAR